MTPPSRDPHTLSESDDAAVRALYRRMLDGWNARDADAFAAPFADDAEVIGFDGSLQLGKDEIAATLGRIFADHPTGTYYAAVKSVRAVEADLAILRAAVGIVPSGQSDINPALNAWQTLTVARRDGDWHAVLLQNTPAQFHGRPDLVEAMSAELRHLLP